MSDDFGTINVSRSERAREIEVMREHYRRHREAIENLIADAPTEQLAQQYQRLVRDIDIALAKLDELEGAAPPPPTPPTQPGMQPLRHQPEYSVISERKPGAPASRVVLILFVAFIGLALIGWLIWKASDKKGAATGTVVETSTSATAPVTTETEPDTIEPASSPAASSGGLVASPDSQDYGVVRKGTRAVRKFTIRNDSDEPASIKVSRSACRCLYYQHAPVIPPKNSETLSVTIDGAKAKAGNLRESLQITTSDPSVKTSVDVIATVR